jgi:hypothetical protein
MFRQRDVRHQVPRFEFIGVNRFSGVVFGEALSQIARRADVSLVRVILASQEVDVIHESSPSLAGLELVDPDTSLVTRRVLPLLSVLRRAPPNAQKKAPPPNNPTPHI